MFKLNFQNKKFMYIIIGIVLQISLIQLVSASFIEPLELDKITIDLFSGSVEYALILFFIGFIYLSIKLRMPISILFGLFLIFLGYMHGTDLGGEVNPYLFIIVVIGSLFIGVIWSWIGKK